MGLFERVKFLADKKKMSINELESELKLSTNTIYRWKKQTPNADRVKLVAEYFNVSTDYLHGLVNYDEWELLDRIYKRELNKVVDKKSITDDINEIISGISNLAYLKDIEEMSEETQELLLMSLKQAARIAEINKDGD